MTSGLDIQKLKSVWAIAARTSNDYMVREEFYVAMRLVAYLQNDMPANENSIVMNLVAPLPRFDDYKPATPGAGPSHSHEYEDRQPARASFNNNNARGSMSGGIETNGNMDFNSQQT